MDYLSHAAVDARDLVRTHLHQNLEPIELKMKRNETMRGAWLRQRNIQKGIPASEP